MLKTILKHKQQKRKLRRKNFFKIAATKANESVEKLLSVTAAHLLKNQQWYQSPIDLTGYTHLLKNQQWYQSPIDLTGYAHLLKNQQWYQSPIDLTGYTHLLKNQQWYQSPIDLTGYAHLLKNQQWYQSPIDLTGYTSSWNMSRDCCLWDGVICDGSTGNVIERDLSCDSLVGKINSNINLFQFSHLERLNLSRNIFSNSHISPKFDRFSSLTHLDLSYTSFSGQIPSEISHLSKLQPLHLLNYDMKLGPHNFKLLLQNLTQLRQLDFSSVNISSTIPPIVSSHLTTLRLGDTRLYRIIPESIFHLPNLKELDLSYNDQLSVYFSTTKWNSNASLKELYLFQVNFFSGNVDVKQLSELDLSYNSISMTNENKVKSTLPEFLTDLGLSACEVNELDFLRSAKQLSHLEGCIPRGPQFDTFENNSGAGNNGLCGSPVSKDCGNFILERGKKEILNHGSPNLILHFILKKTSLYQSSEVLYTEHQTL
ncbi:receptor-like protein 9DC1 [Lycium barbarum]|uniref:receptor-like protein 9DC1 n=1 Tax=Lycium barbarum TaxID=112863 RepID=UPI00293F1FE2|nr:receptor-like protein 9DC1 [Lycium barbarum]